MADQKTSFYQVETKLKSLQGSITSLKAASEALRAVEDTSIAHVKISEDISDNVLFLDEGRTKTMGHLIRPSLEGLQETIYKKTLRLAKERLFAAIKVYRALVIEVDDTLHGPAQALLREVGSIPTKTS